MNTRRILAEHSSGKVHLRMLGTSLRQVLPVNDDGMFDDLLRQLDNAGCAPFNQQEPTPRP